MIGLWNAAREWDGKRNFPPFACACIRNAMRNYLRDKTKIPILEDIEEWDTGEEQEEIAAQSSILSLFVGDSVETRVAILLSQGWQKKEIAEKMGIHPQTVSRICGKIRERIEEQING
jgi:RNA polymerase sigma factor (sigma-70 family)